MRRDDGVGGLVTVTLALLGGLMLVMGCAGGFLLRPLVVMWLGL